MKRTSQRIDLFILLIYLIAVTGNCVPAGQVTLDPAMSATTVISESNYSDADNSESQFADNERDDSSKVIIVQNSFIPTYAVLFSVTFSSVVVAAVTVKRSTILRL